MTHLFLAAVVGLAPGQPDDALPPGAVARMGTTRYRIAENYPRVLFSTDADTVAVVGHREPLRFMDVPSGRVVGELALPSGHIRDAAAFATGDRLVVVADLRQKPQEPARATVCLIDTAARKVLWRLNLPGTDVQADWRVRLSADGTRVATAVDTDLRVWDAATGKELTRYADVQTITALDLSPDGSVVAFRGGFLRVWRWETEKEPRSFTPAERDIRPVVRFIDGGRAVLSQDAKGNDLAVWDVATAKQTGTGRLGRWLTVQELSPDGKVLAGATVEGDRRPGEDHAVILADAATGRELAQLSTGRNQAFGVAWSADGRRVAAVTHYRLHVWDAANHRPIGSPPPGHEGDIHDLAFAPDGTLVTAGSDRTVRTWDAAGRPGLVLRAGDEGVGGVALAPDGSRDAGFDRDGVVRVWDAKTGAEVAKSESHDRRGTTRRIAFTADGERVLSIGGDAILRAIEARTGRLVAAHRLNPSDAGNPDQLSVDVRASAIGESAAFSRDAAAFAHATPTGVRVIDTQTGDIRMELDTGKLQVVLVAFSPDGKRLALARRGPVRFTGDQRAPGTRVVELWDLADGKKLWSAETDGRVSQQLTFSPDGAWVATTARLATDEKAVRLLDATTGADAGRLAMPARPGHFAFDRTSRRIAVAFRDTTAVVFDVAAVRVRP
ncbi:MAG TPA: hypothetical protein VD866_09925 [Urbifossiella sp.]|nr:hypothetical protein [Urbifossiella sp.]